MSDSTSQRTVTLDHSVRLDPAEVNRVFASGADQAEVLIALYKLVLPNWDDIDRILGGWPAVSNDTWVAICDKFFTFDQQRHPGVLPGGLWLNQGFSGPKDRPLEKWEVSLHGLTLRLKGLAPVNPAE